MQHSEQLLRSPDGLGTGCVRGVQGHGGNLYVHRIWFSLRCTGSAFYRLKKKKNTESQKKHHLGKAAYGVQILCLYPCAGN